MPLIRTPYQPLGFGTKRPTDCFNCHPLGYKMPMIQSDFLLAQFTQTPCNASIACDGDFTAIDAGVEVITDQTFIDLEAEQLVNGTFTGNATGWSFAGQWAYAANAITKTAGAAQPLFQTVGLAVGMYKVVFTVSGYSAGNITPVIQAPSTTTFTGAAVSSNTTSTQYFKITEFSTLFQLLPNAAFAGTIDSVSVRRIAPSWTFEIETNGGWTMNANGKPTISNSFSFLRCNGVVKPNTDYTLEIEILDGNGDFSAWVGGTNTAHVILAGGPVTFTQTITSGIGTDFLIQQSSFGADVTIDSVSLIEVTGGCWNFTTALWSVGNESLCKIPGIADVLENQASLISGTYYQIKFSVSGRTQGSMTPLLNSVSLYGAPITTNGNFVVYNTPAANSLLQFFADATFDGCISNVEIFELKTDYLFELYDDTDTLIADLSSFISYYQNYVTLKTLMSDIVTVDAETLPYGCYYIKVFDECEIQYEELVRDGEMGTPVGEFTGSYWASTIGNPATNSIQNTGGQMVITRGALDGYTDLQLTAYNIPFKYPDFTHEPTIDSGTHNYRVEFDIIQNSDPANILVGVTVASENCSGYGFTPGHYTCVLNVDIENYVPSGYDTLIKVAALFNGTTAGVVKFDNVSVKRIEPYDAAYQSEWIKYAREFECTSLIESYADNSQMGFKFYDADGDNIFKLSQRIYIRAINPTYPEDTDDYLFSEGTQSRNFGQSKKYFLILTDLLPEWVHDALRLQKILQHFFIENAGDNSMTEFFAVPGDYIPEWLKNGDSNLAAVRFEVQIKDTDVKFFRMS